MEYSIRKVSSRKALNVFLNLPYKIYKDNSNWVTPIIAEVRRTIDPKKNPYFNNANIDLFLSYKGNEAISRIAIVTGKINHTNQAINKALFGFFESINDKNSSMALFSYVEDFCKAKGIVNIEGPFNPNHYSEMGIKLDKFNCFPSFFQTYNPDYYSILLENSGFKISKQLHTMTNNQCREYVNNRYGDFEAYYFKGYNVRSFSMRNFKSDLEILREVNNDAFSSNWHFIPLSKEEYLFSAKFLKLVTYPNLIKIVEYNNKPVGAIQCVLDINPLLMKFKGQYNPLSYLQFRFQRKNIKKIIIYAVGIKKAYRGSKVYLLLLNEMCRLANKYNDIETTWMTDSNIIAIKAAESLGMVPDKQFAMYEKYFN